MKICYTNIKVLNILSYNKMFCCMNKAKRAKYEKVVECIQSIYEPGCIRLICVMDLDGKVLKIFNRNDISSLEIDTLLTKISLIKNLYRI